MNFFQRSKVAKAKIDNSTAQVLELEAQKKRLEIDRDQISLELENVKKREGMKLEEVAHKQRLTLESEKAVFSREKEIWAKEKEELVARNKREKDEFETRLRKENDLVLQEAVTLTKLESQQKIMQAGLDKDRELTKLAAEHSTAIAELQATLAEKYYAQLTNAFQDLQMNGDKNSRFIQDLALKMFDKVPESRTSVRVDANMPRLVAPTEA